MGTTPQDIEISVIRDAVEAAAHEDGTAPAIEIRLHVPAAHRRTTLGAFATRLRELADAGHLKRHDESVVERFSLD